MVSRAIWKISHFVSISKTQIAPVLRTRAILIVFEKLTCACFFQIALETLLLPIYTNTFDNQASVNYYLRQEVMFLPLFVYLSVCLSVCHQDIAKSIGPLYI